jgi:hypothetical protein
LTATASPTADAMADAFVGRISTSVTNALEVICVYIGDRLGFYRALHDQGPATAPELAKRAGTNERYRR